MNSAESSAEPSSGPTRRRVRYPGEPIRRSRNGCLTCRKRKVKCDERPGTCLTCTDLRLSCVWSTSPASTAELGPDARLTPAREVACAACRRGKVRCTRERPSCARCNRLSMACAYTPVAPSQAEIALRRGTEGERRVPAATGSTGLGTMAAPAPAKAPVECTVTPVYADTLASRAELDQVLMAFFAHVYPVQTNAYVHRGQLLRDVHDGTASPLLVKAICAVSMRFLPSADARHVDGGTAAARWAQEAKHGILLEPGRYYPSKLAALLLLVHHEYTCGRIEGAWLLVAMGTRMALAMGFHLDHNDGGAGSGANTPSLPWAERETRRRLMWSAFCADSMAAGGLQVYMTCPAASVRVALPCSEANYSLSMPVQCPKLAEVEAEDRIPDMPPGADGPFARYIRLISIRNDMLRFVKTLPEHRVPPWEPTSEFHNITARLAHWQASLPTELAFSIDNLYMRHGSGELELFWSVHLWYERLHCTLFRLALPGFDVPQSFIDAAPQQWIRELKHACFSRSQAVVDSLRMVQDCFPGLAPTGWMFGSFIFETIKTQLAYVANVYGDDGPPADLADDLERGFRLMVDLVAKMTTFSYHLRRQLRDLVRTLNNSGYAVSSIFDAEELSDSNRSSPVPESQQVVRGHMAQLAEDNRAPVSPSVARRAGSDTNTPHSTTTTQPGPTPPVPPTSQPEPVPRPTYHTEAQLDVPPHELSTADYLSSLVPMDRLAPNDVLDLPALWNTFGEPSFMPGGTGTGEEAVWYSWSG